MTCGIAPGSRRAGSRRPVRRPVAVLALALAAALAGGCGLGPTPPEPIHFRKVSVAKIVEAPAVYTGGRVRVTGIVTPLGERGFVLTDDGRSIYVRRPVRPQRRLSRGDTATFHGAVQGMSRFLARNLQDRFSREQLRGAPVGMGAPYIELRRAS
jgi:hypothetical protein